MQRPVAIQASAANPTDGDRASAEAEIAKLEALLARRSCLKWSGIWSE